ncbi:MAG: TonB-dependent siderophore receptor [Rhodanobacteraceae bacterium]|nr:TonB-dependent siderophore receptor [Rhodanobacteraceae bacterium]
MSNVSSIAARAATSPRLLAVALAAACAGPAFAPAAARAAEAATFAASEAADDRLDAPGTELDPVEVNGFPGKGYRADRTSTATKTDTPLRDIPQAISVVTRAQIRDQAVQSLAEAVRYVPGVGFAQGEGNRDTAIFRGSSSTADFYIDGMRDDTQYFRDLYNIERVEVLKGPNAMIFGRGGSGGVLNRVSKAPGWNDTRELGLTLGSWNDRRLTGDVDQALGDTAALRVTGVYEDSDSYRHGYSLERWGINPTLSFRLGENTLVTAGYEHFKDERTADRGIPSFRGRPLATDPSTFFGNAELSPTWAEVDALNLLVDHEFADGVTLRNRTRWADYSKFYQNVFPGAVNAAGTEVALSAYSNATERTNLFNQTDLTFAFATGALRHEVLAGAEFGRQDTDNLRQTGYFDGATSISVPVSDPLARGPVVFAPSATDANNRGRADTAALYVQDQVELTPQLRAIVGLRYDRFEVDLRNNRNGALVSATDTPLSPRAGLVYKPLEPLSLYASYSVAYQPRAGEQLASLSASNRSLEPEQFRNLEVGAKWDLREGLAATLAVYRLERSNVAVPDPADPTLSILVDGQRTKGVEFGLAGQLTEAWQLIGGYAYQDGTITRTQSASAQAGARLAQLPEHTFSLWNRYDFSPAWGVGLGAIYRSAMFASTDNTVTLPGFTRFDAAVYYRVNDNLRLQANIENLFDRAYYANANGNNNITPGSPRALRVGVDLRF